jgi:Clr5 domain
MRGDPFRKSHGHLPPETSLKRKRNGGVQNENSGGRDGEKSRFLNSLASFAAANGSRQLNKTPKRKRGRPSNPRPEIGFLAEEREVSLQDSKKQPCGPRMSFAVEIFVRTPAENAGYTLMPSRLRNRKQSRGAISTRIESEDSCSSEHSNNGEVERRTKQQDQLCGKKTLNWEPYEDLIKHMYIDEKRSLDDIVEHFCITGEYAGFAPG